MYAFWQLNSCYSYLLHQFKEDLIIFWLKLKCFSMISVHFRKWEYVVNHFWIFIMDKDVFDRLYWLFANLLWFLYVHSYLKLNTKKFWLIFKSTLCSNQCTKIVHYFSKIIIHIFLSTRLSKIIHPYMVNEMKCLLK